VGKLGASPEAKLAQSYATRATSAGRRLGLGPVDIQEVDGRKPGRAAEGHALLAVLEGVSFIACDGRGTMMGSDEFADLLAQLRDDGARRLAMVVGGADGLDEAVLAGALRRLSFGPQTWPHALARVMLAEQVYRAVTILAGSPYHRA
jgi:23S rRNA (pseudouridine1915-N3)-methyltransferase